MTYRIQRVVEPDAIVFVFSGRLNADRSARIGELIAAEAPSRVRLDLADLTLVDRTGVQFLAHLDATGVELLHCPDYVRRWIAAKRGS